MSYKGVKISLVKKSGPGELIGLTELLVGDDNSVSFDGLQFSDPGTYVISVIPDRTDTIEVGEFTITVQPEEEIIAQERPTTTQEKEENISGDRPCISQVDTPTYNLPPMRTEKPTSEQATSEITSTIGINPYFYYNGIQIETKTIRSLLLYNQGLYPKVEVEFKDDKDILKKYPPLDDTRFEIFFNSQSANIKSIHLRFKYESHNQMPNGYYSITGTIDIPKLYTISSTAYRGTSFEALRKIAKDMNLGFNSNISNTNDSMNWIVTNLKTKDFISQIMAHSYISDESFLIGYIDYYYCFNYVDVEKEWKRDVSLDKAINSNAADRILTDAKEDDRIVPLILTNEKSAAKSSNYIEKFTITNDSTKQSLEKGYSTDIKYYDPKTKSFLEFKVDSLTSDQRNTLSMKGQPGDSKYFEENYITEYRGKIDDDNVHQNYNYAATQNKINFDNLVKISCDLVLPTPNFNLYKFQKVRIIFVNDTATPFADELSMKRYTGEWQIVDISYLWQGGKMRQKIKAVRKELSKTEEEKQNTTNSPQPESRPVRNENPTETAPTPNSEFNFGEVYTVTDGNGIFYEITITDILGNGNEVVGTLKRI